ncbi:carbon starvation protein CstA [Hypnocyclicus thermotrophus]|uniref:Carbon starvation protein CstA n=1 Tax=Hypnocyclicus thermotrophus TaxID=1627895 RepID=A0AA46DZF1_9FUSO|nr:carbon starvation CstA family protein [Hypnocyclicus thermotrophus]TDT71586.1 carbon starvation protein CstA [Hypnocyclicus thermotrophus]
MFTFFISLIILILGYIFYGKYVEKVFGVTDADTPAKRMNDGVDYVEIDWKRAFLIQFLNIAGLGPIFGAIAGALWGPIAFLWIVFGTIFAGAVHDYMSGMLSLKHDGATIGEVVGIYLGNNAKQIMRVFSVVLLVLVGVVFINGPAAILANLSGIGKFWWVGIIIIYYLIATVLPIDKLIAKIYPIFGASLIIMGIGIAGGIIFKGYHIPELTLQNLHPKTLNPFPYLFVTIACGAISGFHATQSPMMARCITSEREGRKVFYGAMVAEGIVALIWAAAAMAFFGSTKNLAAAGSAAVVVNTISNSLLGKIGGALALLGVVAAPITSGDTAFRSARLAIADATKFKQGPVKNRFLIAIPLFSIGLVLCFVDFTILWRYFAWSNQTLATIALWAGAVYLKNNGKNYLIAAIPATFMTSVIITYILIAKEGFKISEKIAYPIGIIVAILALGNFLFIRNKEVEYSKE